jgi:hypothetical protein
LLAFEEAAFLNNEYLATLYGGDRWFFQDIRTALSAIRQCISPESEEVKQLFAVFLATDSKVSNFPPAEAADTSKRRKSTGIISAYPQYS